MGNVHKRRNCLVKICIDRAWVYEEHEIKEGVVQTFKSLLSDSRKWRPSISGMSFKALNSQKARGLGVPFMKEEVF